MPFTSYLNYFYSSSPKKIVNKIRNLFKGNDRSIIDNPVKFKEFLLSDEYNALMTKHLPYNGSYHLYEAQQETASYWYRHIDSAKRLGVFRWRGIQRNLKEILNLVADPDKKIIDFGGAACPLGFYSKIVDQLSKDCFGRKVPYQSLSDLPYETDVIFSSHCLEHVPEIEKILQLMLKSLKKHGVLVLLLPSFTCERWRVGIHSHKKFNNHVWTFGLKQTTDLPKGLNNYLNIDELVSKYFLVEKAEYCGDDSIFMIARKP